MKKFISNCKNFSFNYLDHWLLNEENNLLTLYNPDGYGALNVSYYYLNDNVTIDRVNELIDYVSDNSNEINSKELKPKIINNEKFVYVDLINNLDEYWRYWIYSNKEIILFITYNCENSDIEKEKLTINNIVDSITLDN